ncbi:MAG: WD40 repeat domain-containing protein [Gemmatimonadales bacterium]
MDVAESAQAMVSSSDDGTIAFWDLRGTSPGVTALAERPDGRTQVVATPDGRVFTGDRSGVVREWGPNGSPVGPAHQLSDVPIVSLAVSSAGTRVALARSDGSAQVFELPSAHALTPKLSAGPGAAAVALSPDGQRLVTVATNNDCDACFTLYDLARAPLQGRTLRSPAFGEGKRSPGTAAAFDSTGAHLVTGSRNGWVDSWDPATGVHQWSAGLPRGVRSLAHSPDGACVAVGANSGLLTVLDGSSGERLQQLDGHRGPVVSVGFSPDGTLLASASSQDHAMRLWRLDLGLTVGRPVWLGVDGDSSLAWTDGGRTVVAPHLLVGAMFYSIDPERTTQAACRLAGRNLSTQEWRQYFGESPYRPTCPSYRSAASEPSAGAGDPGPPKATR